MPLNRPVSIALTDIMKVEVIPPNTRLDRTAWLVPSVHEETIHKVVSYGITLRLDSDGVAIMHSGTELGKSPIDPGVWRDLMESFKILTEHPEEYGIFVQPEQPSQDDILLTEYFWINKDTREMFEELTTLYVPSSMRRLFEVFKKWDITLAYDHSKSNGLDIINLWDGARLGHVLSYGNPGWIQELLAKLRALATDLQHSPEEKQVCILDIVSADFYLDSQSYPLRKEDWMTHVYTRPLWGWVVSAGIHMRHNHSMTHGFWIGTIAKPRLLGEVIVFANDHWLRDLLGILYDAKASPESFHLPKEGPFSSEVFKGS